VIRKAATVRGCIMDENVTLSDYTQTIGFDVDPTNMFMKRMERHIEDDCFSDEEQEEAKMSNDENENDFNQFENTPTNLDGSTISGRQASVDILKEMKIICLKYEISSPIENLRIELNSFSQPEPLARTLLFVIV